jgi:hypothetical protein
MRQDARLYAQSKSKSRSRAEIFREIGVEPRYLQGFETRGNCYEYHRFDVEALNGDRLW